MPIYEYINDKTGDTFQVRQQIQENRFNTMKELLDYVEANDDCGFEFSGNERNPEAEDYSEESLDDDAPIQRQIFLTPVHFKGTGWPSATFRNMKYQGKHKKLASRLREERGRRRSKGMSTADVSMELGMKGVTDSVVPDKKWSELGQEQRKHAQDLGFRPSKDWSK